MKKVFIILMLVFGIIGCDTDARVASHNLSKAADMFQINRRIVFFNGITDKYIMVIEGTCSLDISSDALRVTCKTGENTFKKHYLGLSDNVSYFAEQMNDEPVSVYHYKVIFKPQTIIPDVDLSVGGQMIVSDGGMGI